MSLLLKKTNNIIFTLNFNMHVLFGLLYLLCQSNTLERGMAPMVLHDMTAWSRSSVSVEEMLNLAWNLMLVFCSTLIVVAWQ